MIQRAALNTFALAASTRPLFNATTTTLRGFTARPRPAQTPIFRPLFFSTTKPSRFANSTAKMGVHNIQGMDQYNESVVEGSKSQLVVLDCFATWCGPCKAIAPQLVKWSDDPEFSKVTFVKVDVDESPEVASELQVRAMPTFMIFKDGSKVDELVGANPNALKAKIESHM